MRKNIFQTNEARIVCFHDHPDVLNLQLHQWKKSGDLVSLKRGMYMLSDAQPPASEIAQNLYSPSYFSLEYALNFYGIMPETVFEYTLVTPKATRRFSTPMGVFLYQKIKKSAFCGFHSETLMAEKEKALVDYFYLHSSTLSANDSFWEHSRLEAHATDIDFKKTLSYAKLFESAKVISLLNSFYSYAQSRQTSSVCTKKGRH
ncbi:hypothetical protein HZA41_02295 [Candidatus Peregrinibacteria bacterium]|nr:hypothetical protein [Candidatus Peregrinibacteria bacterium]